MVIYIAFTVVAGMIFGHYCILPQWGPLLEQAVTVALCFMVFSVGIDIGYNREAWKKVWQMGFKILLIPLAVAFGSLVGASFAKFIFVSMPMKEILAVSAGLGWYSLSGVLIAQLYSVELGAVAFLANVFREMMAFVLIPLLVGYVGKIPAIAPGGATTMDSTLPLITKATDAQTALIAFMNGLILTVMIPFLIPFILS